MKPEKAETWQPGLTEFTAPQKWHLCFLKKKEMMQIEQKLFKIYSTTVVNKQQYMNMTNTQVFFGLTRKIKITVY